ncbi:MAG TPA: UDP-4-amino-4,6-dideoxy-N-acetyl-beta-L-altrosamine transaminase [Candidatus Hydrogenedentes bacterium]|nr:UDP-4-amino-4,6-dideoxy-N-acetyl-beta-L-altrosamine transaminase [Candidatus Hydrogenedentota bacterium]HIJ72983.1 UDP-4-amino-4,6-dideoxy-N-acetyl-beta-L-altrosamine transaminase [Candidatus Hydrogenedentota bacterium]
MRERLAVDGGAPVRATMLPYGHQVVDDADIKAVADVLRSQWLTTGPALAEYEAAFAQRVGAAHAVAVSSGTAALHAAAHAAGIGPKDEAITSPITFAATANCVLYCGGRVAFADVQPETCNLDPEQIGRQIAERTKAILAVHYAGQPCDMHAIHAVAERHNLVVIEDAAHALGASYDGRNVGTLGQLAAFSTHPVKHITTGEGGMVTTNDDALAYKLRVFRNHGIADDAHTRAKRGDWRYDMTDLGYNYRMADVLAALGKSQLTKLDAWLARRRAIARRFDDAFASLGQLELIPVRPDRESARHFYPVRLNLERLRVGRADVFRALRAEGIGVNVHYIPVYWHPHYQKLGYPKGLCPEAEAQYERLITLPLWAGMTDRDAEDVIAATRKVLAAYAAG